MKRFLSIMIVLCLAVTSFGFTNVFALSETYQDELETNVATPENLNNEDTVPKRTFGLKLFLKLFQTS